MKNKHITQGDWRITFWEYAQMTTCERAAALWIECYAGLYESLESMKTELADYLDTDEFKMTVVIDIKPSGRYIDGSIACHSLFIKHKSGKRVVASVRTPFYESGAVYQEPSPLEIAQ
jgi:hypothetical protein